MKQVKKKEEAWDHAKSMRSQDHAPKALLWTCQQTIKPDLYGKEELVDLVKLHKPTLHMKNTGQPKVPDQSWPSDNLHLILSPDFDSRLLVPADIHPCFSMWQPSLGKSTTSMNGRCFPASVEVSGLFDS